MKTKKIFSLTLICMLLVSIIFGGTNVSANAKKSLKVTYKGKTITLSQNFNVDKYGRNKNITFAKCEKAWGKAKKVKSGGIVFYAWKSKKTLIEMSNYKTTAGEVGAISISVKDKNCSVSGVKVGMSKAKALKKLNKTFGSKNVKVTSKYIYIKYGGKRMPTEIQFNIKKGKISEMIVFRT